MRAHTRQASRLVSATIVDAVTWAKRPDAMRRYRTLQRDMLDPDTIPILAERGLVFVPVPKAANTSIKTMMTAAALGGDAKAASGIDVHDPKRSVLPTPRRFGIADFFDLIDRPSTLVFTAVRNPYDRIVSAYRHLFARFPIGGNDAPLRHLAQDFFGGDLQRLDQNEPLPFDWFVELASATAATNGNLHWRRMVDIVPTTAIKLDLIIKIENLAEELKPVCARLGADTIPVLNVSSAPGLDMSDTQKARVRLAYRDDFEFFGYPQ